MIPYVPISLTCMRMIEYSGLTLCRVVTWEVDAEVGGYMILAFEVVGPGLLAPRANY